MYALVLTECSCYVAILSRKSQRQGEELLWYLLIHYKQQEQGYLTPLLENSS